MLQLMYPGFLHNRPKSQSFPYTTVRTVNIVQVETYQREIHKVETHQVDTHRWVSILYYIDGNPQVGFYALCLGGNPPVSFHLAGNHTDYPYSTVSEITSYSHKVALKSPQDSFEFPIGFIIIT